MKPDAIDTPPITDAACNKATGRTLQDWFAELDGLGGPGKGRRELVNHVYAATGKNEWWSTTIVVEYERARGAFEKDGRPKGYSICSTKTVAAPLARVFAAFGTATDLDVWLGPGTEIRFQDGGSLENRDGDRATFTRIRPDKDLRLDWNTEALGPGTRVEVLFADKGKGKTGITLNHTRIDSRRDADLLRAAWSAALDALKSHLES